MGVKNCTNQREDAVANVPRGKSGLNKFWIEFDQEQIAGFQNISDEFSCYSGQKVSGRVYLKLWEQSYDAKTLELEMKGTETVSVNMKKVVTDIFTHKAEVCKFSYALKGGADQTLNFPFSVIIDQNAASSRKIEYGWTKAILNYRIKLILKPRSAYNNELRRPNQAIETSREITIHRTEAIQQIPEEVYNDASLLHHLPLPPNSENQLPVPAHFAVDIHFHRENWFLGENLKLKITLDNSSCSVPVESYDLQFIKEIQATAGPGTNSNQEEVISVQNLKGDGSNAFYHTSQVGKPNSTGFIVASIPISSDLESSYHGTHFQVKYKVIVTINHQGKFSITQNIRLMKLDKMKISQQQAIQITPQETQQVGEYEVLVGQPA